MKTIDKEKSFDTVKMMREVRNKIGTETQNMNLSELKKYIEKQMKESKLKPIGK